MNRNALIIFVRNPAMGKVKTRIAAAIGEQEALRIYKALLQHTHDISINAFADKFVFYSDHLPVGDKWEDDIYYKYLQAGETLGDKMKEAFSQILNKGYEKAIIIVSDCYELTAEIIGEAFESLNKKDAVIGPAKDGGYYLLGIKKMMPEIFENKKWSTASVFNETVADFEKANISCFFLPLLNDVDKVEDVPQELMKSRKIFDV